MPAFSSPSERQPESPAFPVPAALSVALVVAAAALLSGAGGEELPPPAPERDQTSRSSEHWSFRPVRRPPLPAVERREWARTPVDLFVLARLEKEGIAPSPEADRATLIRRLTLDLLGLLPAPQEVRRFAADRGPDAYERLVDRLLASPHFGERWGRHWLDLARYADSDGYEKDQPRPWAWRYRDWVIEAYNRDLPFDRFTIEQLAGDLLPGAGLRERLATGFHRNTLTNREGGVDQEEYRVKAVVDRVNTTGTAWLGLTVGCAECHEHKYDPLTQREYYGLFAFFQNADEAEISAPLEGQGEARAAVIAERRAERRPTHVLIRGDFLRPGERVLPYTPAVLPPLGEASAGARHEPTRLDLARWLLRPDHPLVARVAVNRLWQHLFGAGLVATPEDFGTRGDPPSHPELLDWLASELARRGWSRKALIRRIVCSSTYRQSAAVREDLEDLDPRNRLLARQNRFRLEAEVIRDIALQAGDLLVRRVGGPSVRPPLPAGVAALGYAGSVKWEESPGADRYRRGLYTFFQRTVPYPMLMTFDAPDANVTCTRRLRSNTPLQALTLLNDPVFFECARALGRRLRSFPESRRERLRAGFHIAVARDPRPDELARLERAFADILALAPPPGPARGEERAAEKGAPGPPVPSAGEIAWTAAARILLNLDTFLTRE